MCKFEIDLLCRLLQIIYIFRNKKGRDWGVKLEKYYAQLFEYYNEYRQQMKSENVLFKLHFFLKLLINEWNREITYISRIAVITTTRCSLKCQLCANLIPYFEKKEDIDYKDIIRDIRALEEKVDKIYCVELVGGEPFLHQDLDIILKYVIESKKIGLVEITSNALVQIPEKVVRVLRNPKVLVRFSDYGFNRKNIISITRRFERMHIRYKVLDQEQWCYFGTPKDYGRNKKETSKMFKECFASAICRMMYKGNLMICGRGPFLYEHGYLSDQYVNVNEDGFSTQVLNDFYISSRYNICKYCDYSRNGKRFPRGKQIEGTGIVVK